MGGTYLVGQVLRSAIAEEDLGHVPMIQLNGRAQNIIARELANRQVRLATVGQQKQDHI